MARSVRSEVMCALAQEHYKAGPYSALSASEIARAVSGPLFAAPQARAVDRALRELAQKGFVVSSRGGFRATPKGAGAYNRLGTCRIASRAPHSYYRGSR